MSAGFRVFFHCASPRTAEAQIYPHAAVCLAEGLQELGIECHADRDFWRCSSNGPWLLKKSTIERDECDVVVLDAEWFGVSRELPAGLLRRGRRYLAVMLDSGDQAHYGRAECAAFDVVYRSHYSSCCGYPKNTRPGAFGLCRRVMRELNGRPEVSPAYPSVLHNCRDRGHPHSVRRLAATEFLPRLVQQLGVVIDTTREAMEAAPSEPYHRLMWEQTGRRHHPAYFRRLSSSLGSMCFGGFFTSRRFRDQNGSAFRIARKILTASRLHSTAVQQWDSWRLWETWGAGRVVFHVDLAQYGCVLPNMPENWKHYVGVDLSRPQEAIERIVATPGLLNDIATNGQTWAIRHFSPVAIARRVLRDLTGGELSQCLSVIKESRADDVSREWSS